MFDDLPLLAFTILSQMAVGLALCAALRPSCDSVAGAAAIRRLWLFAFLIGCASLLASLFHLGHPLQAMSALRNLGTAWLSLEVLCLGIFVALALLAWLLPSGGHVLAGRAAALAGLTGLVAQGFTYAPVSMPALHNVFPLALFILTAVVLGASFWRVLTARAAQEGTACARFELAARTGLWLVLVLLVMAPCMWISGGSVMEATAVAWLTSPFFWLGLLCLLLALVLSHRHPSLMARGLAALCGLVLTRVPFFMDVVQTDSHLGKPY